MAQAYITEIASRWVKKVNGNMHDLIMSNGDKLGVGKFPPKGFAAGDYVQYEVTKNGNFKNLVPGSLSKLAKPAGVEPPQRQQSSGSQAARARPAAPDYDARQIVISKQAALNSALTFVNLLASTDSVPGIGKSTTSEKKADILREVVNEYTATFYHQSTGEKFEFPKETTIQEDLKSMEDPAEWNE